MTVEVPHLVADKALEYVQSGQTIGLGTGRAATAFLHALGRRVRDGLLIHGIPTSTASAKLATELGIPLTTFAQTTTLDLAVDGADEVDPAGNLIKGLGGALVREKIVASAAARFIILVGPEKLVDKLGEHGDLPVEVAPFALELCQRRILDLGYRSSPRPGPGTGGLYLSDNGNHILDCAVTAIDDPGDLERRLVALPGVVGTGLFLAMRPMVLVERSDHVEVRDYSAS